MRPPSSRAASLVLLAVALAVTACDRDGDAAPEPSPSELAAQPVVPSPGPSTEPSASPLPAAAPSVSPSPEADRDPTDTDRARFVAEHRPPDAADLEHVAVDVTGDELEELVFTYVRSGEGVSHVDVAAWGGTAYELVAGADGGRADRIADVRIADVNGDGRTEVVISEERGSSGASLTAWAVTPAGGLGALTARGGCHGGSNTYGVIGAELTDRDGDGVLEIAATCDDSPLPVAAWSTHTYVWVDGAYRHDPDRT